MTKSSLCGRSRKYGIALFVPVILATLCLAGNEMHFPQPVPRPATPPPGAMRALDPMMALSTSQNYSAARVSSYERRGGPRDNFWIPTDGNETTLAEIDGPGAITHIWTTHRGDGRDLILRVYWEGSNHPSIEAPLGDFFGVALGLDAPMNSWPIQVSSEGRARNCWWYMPFNKSARVTVSAPPSPTNCERKTVPLYFYIAYRVYDRPIGDIHYFHARFQETDPARRGRPVTLLEAEGDGHFVGLVMGHRARTPGWFGEGDDIITVDGQVSFIGTGTEDYFGEAWGFRVFSNLYYGVPALEGRAVGDRLSVYRFHIMDPIPFRESFKFEIEHWPWISPLPNSSRDYFSSVCFWYQKTVHKPWKRLDRLISHEPWDPHKGRWHVPDALEAEDLEIVGHESSTADNTPPMVQHVMPNLSGDHMLVFDAGGKGTFSLAVPAEDSGTYTVRIYYPRAPDYGIVQLRVNGRAVGDPADIFLKTDDLTRPLWPSKPYEFPNIPLKKGPNLLTFSIDSKNPKSEGYKVGIDCLVLKKEKR